VCNSAWGYREKKSLHASERDTARVQQARAIDHQRITGLDLRRVKFVNEAGVNLAMTRAYGRAPARERVMGSVPQNYSQNVTMLGALSVQGLHAVMTVDGATDTDVFRTYVRQVLGPTLTPGDSAYRGESPATWCDTVGGWRLEIITRHPLCTRTRGSRVEATTAPEGEDHVKVRRVWVVNGTAWGKNPSTLLRPICWIREP
jgi:DDE superfamily endonuclease